MRLLITLVAMTALSLSTPAAQKTHPDVFPKAKLNIQVGERTRQVEVTLKYEANALVLADRKTTLPLKDNFLHRSPTCRVFLFEIAAVAVRDFRFTTVSPHEREEALGFCSGG